MPFLGMAPDEVQNLGTLLSTTIPGEIDTIISKVSGQLGSTQWVGTDRDKFESDWSGEHVAQLTAVKTALETFGQHALTEAQQQTDASAT